MPIFEIQGPNGETFEIDAPDQNTAIQSLSGMMQEKQPSRAGEWSTFNEAMDMVTGGLMTKGNAALEGVLDAGLGAVKGEGWNYSDNYNRSLERQRQAQSDYQEENPVLSGIGKAAGLGLGITSMPVIGSGLKGAAATGAAYGGVMGAGQDANSIEERVMNAVKGTATGAGIGAAGYGLGKAAGMGATKLNRAWQSVSADPQTKAAMELRDLAEKAGGSQAVQKALDDLGPDAMAVDVLGEGGRALGRNASNISPMARETLEAAVLGRKAGQNQRVVSDMERLAGLQQGSTKTVDDLVEAVDKQYRPQVDRLYSMARRAGKDIPLNYFSDVLGTKQGRQVFQQAGAAVKARARLAGTPDEISNLAIIDEMKKIFDSKAQAAFQSGDRASGSLWADFAKNVRTRADVIMDSMEDPIYKQARAVAQEMNKAKDAVRLGETMGGPRVAMNLPEQAQGLDSANRQRLAQGYVAKKSDTLLNRGSTEGALNELSTPMGGRAANAALGPGSMAPTLSREKTFNQTAKALTGNSTTARQLAEMGLGTGAATYLLSGDPLTGGIAGVLGALARKGAPAIARKLATDSQRKTAPLIAELLTQRGLPSPMSLPPPGTLEKLSNADKGKLLRAMILALSQHTQNTSPQTAAANQ